MHFRISDTFTDSLAKLTGDEQKAVKTTAFDLQLNPSLSGRSDRSLANPGMQFHRLDSVRDPHFCEIRNPLTNWPVQITGLRGLLELCVLA